MGTIIGTSGNDTLIGTSGNDTIYGLEGNDLIVGSAGADSLFGGSGSDTFLFSNASYNSSRILDFETGIDKLSISFAPVLYIYSSGGNTIVLDVPAAQTMVGGANYWGVNIAGILNGNDIVSNATTMYISGDAGPNTLIGADGLHDFIEGFGGQDLLTGGNYSNTYVYADISASFSGGSDLITNFVSGRDTIQLKTYGSGQTIVLTYSGLNTIISDGNGGNFEIDTHGRVSASDISTSSMPFFTIIGDNSGDQLIGTSGADTIIGNDGNDLVIGNGGPDILSGGAGADTFKYVTLNDSTASAADLITDFQTGSDVIDLATVAPTQVSVIRSGSASFVFASTSAGSMMIDVNGAVNAGDISWGTGHAGVYLVGDDRGDTLLGGVLGDAIHGGLGNDLIIGGAGADGLFGGAGSDTFKYTSISDSTQSATDLVLDFQTGSDKIDLTALSINHISTIDNGTAEFVFIETTSGQSMEINFVGADVVQAGDFNVTGGTNFYLQGDSGNNRLIGGAGNDVIDGHSGNDLIIGGGGSDALFGGAGNDTFKYLAANDSTVAAPDTIFDFQTGVDKIDLTGVHAAGAGTYGIAHNATGSYLFVDVNGDGVNDMLIQIVGTLNTSDVLWTTPSAADIPPASVAPAIPTAEISAAQFTTDLSVDTIAPDPASPWSTHIFQPHTDLPTDLLHV